MKRFACSFLLVATLSGCDLADVLSWLQSQTPQRPITGGINAGEPAGAPVPEIGEEVTLLVISESRIDADVVILFSIGDIEVRRAELHAPSFLTLDPVGPDLAVQVAASGYYATGDPTPTQSWILGTDFVTGDTIEYIIPDDECPDDPNKVTPGQCGCGEPDTDSDNDGTADCIDLCRNDPDKILPGRCGCDTPDTDTDNDGTPDCADQCRDDPDKILPGQCGCDTPDTDTDNDRTADCNDECPDDPGKTLAGICGCGVSDGDSDDDGTADCEDECLVNPDKILAGQCGCDEPDTDSDNDGTADCIDLCPNDPNKIEPGRCGCGKRETSRCGRGGGGGGDTDACPNDPLKTEPGVCGCGVRDIDSDGDLLEDCIDNCPDISNLDQSDDDFDGVGTACDECPETPLGIAVRDNGCYFPVDCDFDDDLDVDMTDFGHLQFCYSGPDVPQDDPSCQDALLDQDNDVDQMDFLILQGCLSGPGWPAAPQCLGG